MSKDSVSIALTISALNDLDMMACNIHNAYIKVDFRNRVWVVDGPKFGSEAGNHMLARKALYGLKSSGTDFRAFLAETVDKMGYRPSYSDPELWLQPAVKLDGSEYYEYIICYVNDVLCISHNPQK